MERQFFNVSDTDKGGAREACRFVEGEEAQMHFQEATPGSPRRTVHTSRGH